jgi:hypothetical protein
MIYVYECNENYGGGLAFIEAKYKRQADKRIKQEHSMTNFTYYGTINTLVKDIKKESYLDFYHVE